MQQKKSWTKSFDQHTLLLFLLSVLIIAFMGFYKPKFLGNANLQSMLVQLPEYGILAFGMMIAMVSGGIDLSLVGIANLSGIVAAVVMLRFGGTPAAITAGICCALAVGVLCGMFNGFLIGYLKIPAMLVTLSGLQVFSGLCLIITKGPAITGLPESFAKIANATFFGVIPYSALVFILIVAALSYLMNQTVFGRQLYLMGTNTVAASFTGINILRTTVRAYVLSGILGAIAGILMASHYNSAKSDYGSSYTLLTLLIVVLGGIDPNGGDGKTQGVVFSIILLQLVSSAFNILRINAFIKTFAWGLILIFVLAVLNIPKIIREQKKG
ncbi:ABC transporter permease [Anaerolineaceae bacterium oral taxon 439]|nr:ABC transporter permease [Anaerolineaceae bacterium oral taxon 439]